jgi:hypothetical protein
MKKEETNLMSDMIREHFQSKESDLRSKSDWHNYEIKVHSIDDRNDPYRIFIWYYITIGGRESNNYTSINRRA